MMKVGSLGIAVMLGWIAKSSRHMWSKNKRFAYIYGICQSLVSKITATPNEPEGFVGGHGVCPLRGIIPCKRLSFFYGQNSRYDVLSYWRQK
jgi:hypothetical protein